VEQYFVLDPKSVTRLGPSAFRCRIPRMAFFSVWLEPEVEVEVHIAETHVHMRSRGTHLHGSDFVQRSGLNDRFDMFWCTTLTWGDQARGAAAARASSASLRWLTHADPLSVFALLSLRACRAAPTSTCRRR